MNTETFTTLHTILKADSSVPDEQRDTILKACRQAAPRKRLGTVREAAAILAVHPRTLQRWGRRGLLTPVRITPRRQRWDLDEVERLATEGVCNE